MSDRPEAGRRANGTRVGVLTREVAALFGIGLAGLFWVVGESPDGDDVSGRAAGLRAEWRAHSVATDSLLFHPDGNSLISTGRDGGVGFWGRTLGQPVRGPLALGMGETVATVARDGRTFAVASHRGGVRVWDEAEEQGEPEPGTAPGRLIPGLVVQAHALGFSPDDQILAIGGLDGTLHLWDRAGWRTLASWKAHEGCIHTLAFSPDGRSIATGSMDGQVRIWERATGTSFALPVSRPHPILQVVFSPDGRTVVASGRESSNLTVWDLDTRRLVAEPKGPEFCISALAFHPDGRHLFVGGAQRHVDVLSTRSWERVRIIPGVSAWIKNLAVSPDGRSLAIGAADGHVRVWDLDVVLGRG